MKGYLPLRERKKKRETNEYIPSILKVNNKIFLNFFLTRRNKIAISWQYYKPIILG